MARSTGGLSVPSRSPMGSKLYPMERFASLILARDVAVAPKVPPGNDACIIAVMPYCQLLFRDGSSEWCSADAVMHYCIIA